MINNIKNKFKSNNKTEFKTLGMNEMILNGMSFTVVPNEIEEIGIKYDATHFFVMYNCLKFANSSTHKISIENLSRALNIGKEKVGKVLNNLIKEGYLKREPYFEGGRRMGFVYTVYNHLSSRSSENHNLENHNLENQYTKKENKQKENKQKENSLFVSHNPKLDLILKSFKDNGLFINKKIEKILKDNLDNFEEDLFIKIFDNIANSRDKINNVLSYISRTFKVLKDKGIKTLEEFLKDQENYFGAKKEINKSTKNEKQKENKKPKIHTRHHDIEQTFTKYEDKELEEMLLRKQRNKFKTGETEEINKEKELESLYKLAEESPNMLYNKSMFKKYWDILTDDLKEKVISYAKENNRKLAQHCIL